MSNDSSKKPEPAEVQENLISMKNVGLVALPWLLFQQDMVKEVKKVIENEDHPIRGLFSQLGKTAYNSQMGAQIALRNRPAGKSIIEASEPLGKAQVQLKEAFDNRRENLAESAMSLVEFYEIVLDATVDAVREKTGKYSGASKGKSPETAAASEKQAAPKKKKS